MFFGADVPRKEKHQLSALESFLLEETDGEPSRIGEYTHVRLDHTTGSTFAGVEVAGARLMTATV